MYRKRLIASAVSIYTLGVVFAIVMNGADTFSFRAVFIVLSVCSVICLAVLARSNGHFASKQMSAAALAVAAFSFGVLRVSLYNDAVSSNIVFDNKNDTVVLEIADISQTSVNARIISSEIKAPNGELIKLYTEDLPQNLVAGDIIFADVTYNYKFSNSFLSNGISLSAYGKVTGTESGNGLFYSVRKSISENSSVLYNKFENSSAIAKAVISGDRSDMDSYLFSVYKSAGISHVLAISGLHISILSISLYNILIAFSVNRNAACVLSAAFSVCYASLVGFTAGAVRAAVMLSVVMLSRMFMRRADGFTSLFIALLILLLVNPYSIYSAGLQLSFLCSLGIMLAEPLISNVMDACFDKQRDLNGIASFFWRIAAASSGTALSTFTASVFSFPVLCFGFDTVSFVSPLANIVAVPLFTYGIELAIIAYLIAPVSNTVAMLFSYPAGLLFEVVTSICKFIHDFDIGIVSVHIPLMIIPLILSLVMIGSMIFLIHNRNRVFAVSGVLFFLSIFAVNAVNTYQISEKYVIEYGNDSGEYIYYSDKGENVYIDIGGYTSCPDAVYNNGSTKLEHYLMLDYNSFSLERFDYLSGSIKVSNLYLPNPKNASDANFLQEIKELANERNCDIMYFEEFFTHSFSENSNIEVYGTFTDISAETLICINIGETKIRFLGDGFNNAVSGDIVVATEGYIGNSNDIVSENVFAPNDYISDNPNNEKYFSHFDKSLRIEIDSSESEINIYEP